MVGYLKTYILSMVGYLNTSTDNGWLSYHTYDQLLAILTYVITKDGYFNMHTKYSPKESTIWERNRNTEFFR